MTPNNQPTTTISSAVRANFSLLWLARHWLRVALFGIAIYTALPFAAPILMHNGATGPANVIYTAYKPFCHQFVFRSFFLFGEQTVYPRANTGTSLGTFEDYARDLPEFAAVDLNAEDEFSVELIRAARSYVGNEQMGYKLTLCERDISIYLAILVGGLIFAQIRRKLRPVPLWLYAILGLGPIGLDGFSQLLGYPPFEFWPPRETQPLFRVITGVLFGLMNAWLVFPYLEGYMRDTRRRIEEKLYRAGYDV